jgi:antitoxin ParD1/3/4
MSVTLTVQVEGQIRRWIESGEYANADAVVTDALRLLDERHRLKVLRAKIQVGLDEADWGEVDEWTPELRERLRREAHEMHLRGEEPDQDVTPPSASDGACQSLAPGLARYPS